MASRTVWSMLDRQVGTAPVDLGRLESAFPGAITFLRSNASGIMRTLADAKAKIDATPLTTAQTATINGILAQENALTEKVKTARDKVQSDIKADIDALSAIADDAQRARVGAALQRDYLSTFESTKADIDAQLARLRNETHIVRNENAIEIMELCKVQIAQGKRPKPLVVFVGKVWHIVDDPQPQTLFHSDSDHLWTLTDITGVILTQSSEFADCGITSRSRAKQASYIFQAHGHERLQTCLSNTGEFKGYQRAGSRNVTEYHGDIVPVSDGDGDDGNSTATE